MVHFKKYPLDYNIQVQNVINAMSLGGTIKIIGSGGIKELAQYAGDIDCDNIVKFKNITHEHIMDLIILSVHKLLRVENTYFSDLKIGDQHFTVDDLHNKKILYELIYTNPLIKMDAVSYVSGKYIEISTVYEIYINNELITKLKSKKQSHTDELKNEINKYKKDKNYFKASKRLLSIYISKNNDSKVNKMIDNLYNGDLAKIYSLISDLSVILWIVENRPHLPVKKIEQELNNSINNISTLVLPLILRNEKLIIKHIYALVNAFKTDDPNIIRKINQLMKELNKVLQYYTKKQLNELNIKI